MSSVRKNHPASFKANVVLEALREDTPISNLASKYGVHAKVIHRWKKEAMASIEAGFYYKLKGESPLNLKLMRLIDEQFLKTPFYGSRQMARYLSREWLLCGSPPCETANAPDGY